MRLFVSAIVYGGAFVLTMLAMFCPPPVPGPEPDPDDFS